MSPSPSGPPTVAQVLAPGVLLLGSQGIALVRRALDLAERAAARDAISLPPAARDLQAALAEASSGFGTALHAHVGTSEPLGEAGRAWSAHGLVGVTEVVQVLEVSREYACRLLRDGAFETGRKIGGRWQLDLLELHEWRDARQEVRTA